VTLMWVQWRTLGRLGSGMGMELLLKKDREFA